MQYFFDLEKWQASSHPQLARRKPEDLFTAEFAKKYQTLHHDIWYRMIQLHGTLYSLEKLKEFAFEYLYDPNHMEFWRLVDANFFGMCIVLLNGLVNDRGSDAHTLRSFKNMCIKAQWSDPQLKKLLEATLKEREFDANLQNIAERVKRIRTIHIAHRLKDKQTGLFTQQLEGVSLTELRQLFDGAHALFGALSFGTSYVTLSMDYAPSTTGGQPNPTSLDKVLDAVLRDSYFVNQPERLGPSWPDHRKLMDTRDLQMMNDLRRRIGLPDA